MGPGTSPWRAVPCRATVVAVLACPGGRLGYLSTVPNHSKVALKINVGTTSQVIAVHQRSTCQSQFKYPQVVSVGIKQRKESATASIGDILLPRKTNSHLHARRDTVVHVDATAVHGTVHRGVRHRAAPCWPIPHRYLLLLPKWVYIHVFLAQIMLLARKLSVSARLTTVVFGFLRHMVHHGVQYFAAPAATAAPAPGLCILFLPPSSRWRPTSIPQHLSQGVLQATCRVAVPSHTHSAAVHSVGKDMADNWKAGKHSTRICQGIMIYDQDLHACCCTRPPI
ncbi:hypothetical protein B0H16DRAFT_1702252 [Mycena metata]|uniref:Uncharacterized protein n=1 Tax=Mycena metata TaxID=1033252 RepID=A0AAD7H7I0_9AGAR|nr:hypothetical protein B0H16DRAFT_1702252 [Mycena metata]